MRIAQVAPLYESVPPQLYGGTERVVAVLCDALTEQGHDVTLYASGDSLTSAELVPLRERALRLDRSSVDSMAPHILMMERVAKDADRFDIIHSHIDYHFFPTARRLNTPVVSTLHGRLDLPELPSVYEEFAEASVISISNAQRTPLPKANWIGTVYHGYPADMFIFHPDEGEYLAFLGRISPEKRVDLAIEIAIKSGIPLKIAAKVDKADVEYFETHIRKLLDHPLVEFIGEIGDREKSDFLGTARALLFPVDWPEPFGLVMIESLACGTPVIARPFGSVPEVIREGIGGFVVETVDEAVDAVQRLGTISREGCRCEFEKRFSAHRMAGDYLRLYQQVVSGSLHVAA